MEKRTLSFRPSSCFLTPKKHHPRPPRRAKYFPHDPAFSHTGMSLQCPLPQGFKDGMIYMAEDAFAVDVTVIHRPNRV
jgi:hypothetical protein